MATTAVPEAVRPPRTEISLGRIPLRVLVAGAFAFASVLALVLSIAPFRRATVSATAHIVLFVASPFAPEVADFDELPKVTKILASDGSLLTELQGDERRKMIQLDELPPHVPDAVMAAEDADFYDHDGIDGEGVLRALVRTASGDTQGGSTITQQLAKINFTGNERSLMRKFREAQYVVRLEETYTKDELLQRYLNQVYFGEQAYGVQAAAETYFGKDATDLTVAEAATLGSMIRAPEELDPRETPEVVEKERNRVIDLMVGAGMISPAVAEEEKAKPLELSPPFRHGVPPAPHFVEYVKREALRLGALGEDRETRSSRLNTAGLTVETTLDRRVYEAAERAARAHLSAPGNPNTASATVEPGTGAIKSLFGGLDFAATQYDVSSLGHRQPGSTFKPFVYLAALRDGIDPRSKFDGTSGRQIDCYGTRPVENYAGEDAGGAIEVDEAMRKSVNVVFVELGCEAGIHDVLKASRDAGIPEDATEVQGAAFLGGLDKGVSALEMASAYATFVNHGRYAKPFSISRILDAKGEVIHERGPALRQAFDPKHVAVLNRALQGVVTSGTGRAADIGRPLVGKTGTTQDNYDAWFVGATPQFSTAVWVGYEPKRPMHNVHGRSVTGGSFPASIFGQMMREVHHGVAVLPIPLAHPDDLRLRITGITTTTTTAPPPPPPPPPDQPAPVQARSGQGEGDDGPKEVSGERTSSPQTTTTTKPRRSTTTSTTTTSTSTTSTTAPPEEEE